MKHSTETLETLRPFHQRDAEAPRSELWLGLWRLDQRAGGGAACLLGCMMSQRGFDNIVTVIAFVGCLLLWWWLADRPRFWEWF